MPIFRGTTSIVNHGNNNTYVHGCGFNFLGNQNVDNGSNNKVIIKSFSISGDLLKPIFWCGRQWKNMAKPCADGKKIQDVATKTATVIPLVIATLAALPFAAVGCSLRIFLYRCYSNIDVANDSIVGSGKLAEKKIELGSDPIKTIKLTGLGNVDISLGESNSLTIIADDNLLDVMAPETGENTLRLGVRSNTSFQTQYAMTYKLTLSSAPETVQVSGSGNINIDGLNVENFNCKISGSGGVSLNGGQVGNQVVQISGSGDYNASTLKAGNSQITIRGSGTANVQTVDLLSVNIFGSGDCIEHGNSANVQLNSKGSGRVFKN